MTGRPVPRPHGVPLFGPGAGLALVAVIAVACSGTAPVATFVPSGGIASAAATALASGGGPSAEASQAGATATPAPTATPAATATPAPTEAGSATPSEAAGSPGASILPEVTSFSAPHTASCTSANGTGSVGQIHLSWNAVGTTGVRLSIDPPSADVAYDDGFADYAASGSADVPFSCGAPNHDSKGDYHLYVVTTLHDKGYAMYRYAKVYEVTP